MSVLDTNSQSLSFSFWGGMPPSAGELGSILGQDKVRVFAKKLGHKVMGTWFWDCDSVESLNADGWDIYVVLNKTRSGFVGTKPCDADMYNQQFVLIDYDKIADGTVHELTKAKQLICTISDAYLNMFTGNGYQIWYKWNQPSIHFGLARAQNADLINRLDNHWQLYGVPNVFKVDKCTTDISRLARWPNTINWKTKERGIVYRIDKHLAPRPEIHLEEKPPIKELNKPFTKLSELAPRLNGTASKFLLEGVDHNEQSRHTAAYATARNLREIGLSEERATELVVAGGTLCRRGGQPLPLPEEDSINAVKSAYKAK